MYRNILYFSSLIFVTLVTVLPVYAADVSFAIHNKNLSIGETFPVEVVLNTGSEIINAVEGSIVFPTDLLEVTQILEGGSVINFWIEKPQVTTTGKLTFSGITPGGFSGTKEALVTIIFRTKQVGKGMIHTDGMRALKNDGKGTRVPVTTTDLSFSIGETIPVMAVVPIVKDTDPPEAFTPLIASSSTMFGGNYFLVFATQDKGSGVDRYEVREGRWGRYSFAESPYLLKDQDLDKDIFVKAVDEKGNERIALLAASRAKGMYSYVALLGILGLLFISFFILKSLWQKFVKK